MLKPEVVDLVFEEGRMKGTAIIGVLTLDGKTVVMIGASGRVHFLRFEGVSNNA